MVSPADTRSAPVGSHRASSLPPRRPGRRLLGWIVAVVLVTTVGVVAWRSSDIANTSVLVGPEVQAPGSLEAPGATVSDRWRSGSRPDAAEPVQAATVVVGGTHGVVGRDPATGTERWHYLRSTAILCDWTARDAVVVAIFRSGGGCDEAVALQADTGARLWYRSVTFRADATLSSTAQIVVAESPTGLAALGTTSSGTRWGYRPPAGCRIAQALPGDVGVAVLLSCAAGAKSIALLDGFNGSKRWSVDLDDGRSTLLVADGVVAVSTSTAVVAYGRDGALQSTISTAALTSAPGPTFTAFTVGDRLIVDTGTDVVAVDPVSGMPAWSRPGRSAGPDADDTMLLILARDGGAVSRVSLADGVELSSSALAGAAPPPGARPVRVGATIVLVAPEAVAAYR